MIFLIRSAVWVGCAVLASGQPADTWVWATAGVLVVGGGAAARAVGYPRVNRLLIFVDWLAITVAIHLAAPTSPVFVLYGLESVVLTVYGGIRLTAVAAVVFPLSLLAAHWPATSPVLWFEMFAVAAALLAAGLMGSAFARQQRSLARNRRRLVELAGLRAIQESLLQDQPLEMLMSTLVTESLQMLGLDIGYVGLMEEGGWMLTAAAIGLPSSLLPWRWDPYTSEPTRTALETRQPQIVNEPDVMQRTGLAVHGVRTLVVAPMFDGHKPVGVLGLGSRRPETLDVDVFPVLDSLVGLAVGQIRFDRERMAARTRGRMIASLERVSRILNSNLKMNVLLPTLHSALAEELQPDAFFVALLIPDDPAHAYIAYMYDDGKVYEPKLVDLKPEGPTAQVMRDGEPRRFRGDVPGASAFGSGREPMGWMVAPLKHESRVVGAISAQSYRMLYNQDHLDFLSSVANQAAVAIENARLYEQSEQIALTDHLTGLGNDRQFARVLERCIRDATDKDEPLALLMIDSDSLKRINDRYGHNAGDEHLKHLANAIRQNVRTDDIACRYAGDEFVVLLPRTGLSAAEKVAQRICAAAGEGFLWQGRRLNDQSVSIGVAVYERTMTGEQIFAAADRAMYVAKQAGGNRVAVAS